MMESISGLQSGLVIPGGYRATMGVRETEKAIKKIKDFFQDGLSRELCLTRVTAPRFVISGTGINDDLNGIEKPVSFAVKDARVKAEIVHSLAKWKRMALREYGFRPGEGLYTDMDAIRADETLDNLHSVYVDQWDWEKVIEQNDRNISYLKDTVKRIYSVMRETERMVSGIHPEIAPILPEEIRFMHSEELLERYPGMSPREREDAACREHGAVFIIGIGGELGDGKPHDGRAPDYDDWTTPSQGSYRGLNGDILVWYPLLERAFELSSMGIRVDSPALEKQLSISRKTERRNLLWHSELLSGRMPLSIGGGIGQSRLCMFFLRKAHIGEVQCGIWPEEMRSACMKSGIFLL